MQPPCPQGRFGNQFAVELRPDDSGASDFGFKYAVQGTDLRAEAACSARMKSFGTAQDQVPDVTGDFGANAVRQFPQPSAVK